MKNMKSFDDAMQHRFDSITINENQLVNEPELVGLDLEFCIKDILEGKVREEQILQILTVGSEENIEEKLKRMLNNSWNKNTEGIKIAEKLLSSNKVKFALNQNHYWHYISEWKWVKKEDYDRMEIHWIGDKVWQILS